MFVAQKDHVKRVQRHPPVPPTLIYLSLNIKMLENFQVVEMETVHPSPRPVRFSLTSVKHSLT